MEITNKSVREFVQQFDLLIERAFELGEAEVSGELPEDYGCSDFLKQLKDYYMEQRFKVDIDIGPNGRTFLNLSSLDYPIQPK